MRSFFGLALALVATIASSQDVAKTASPPASQVTISLAEYQAMRDANDRPSATVVDTIRLGGTFRGRNLTITFKGRTIGNRPLANIIDSTNDVTISACVGAAIVTRTAKGAFALIPIGDTFEVRCDLRLSGSDRLQIHALPNVLAVQANVADGELVAGDEDDDGGRLYSLVRQVTGTGERLAATATGRYRITLLPDATRFGYAIDVHNPNRSTSTLALTLVSNEQVQEIDSAAPYEVEGSRYVFTIPPGDSTINMSGELRGTSFRAPVEASLQYLVLESHPLIRPAIQTPAKRVSIAETGIAPQYRGALAFETGTQQIMWQITRLEALRAISYAANAAQHRFFVPLDGPVLGESLFEIRNEGAAELVLARRPEPTFVSVQNEPILLTKDRTGRLTVPLSTGVQTVLVQHRQGFGHRLGIGSGRVVVPQLEVAASRTNVEMRYPDEWIPLYESFATRSAFWTPDFAMVLMFLGLGIWIERLLAWLSLSLPRRMLVAIVSAAAATAVFTFLVLVIVASAALTLAWLMTLPVRQRIAAAAAVVLAGVFVVIVFSVSNVATRKYEAASGGYSTATMATDTASADRAAAGAPEPTQASKDASTAVSYQGLPARFELPAGSRHSAFSQELLPVDREQSVVVIAVSMVLVKWAGLVLAAAAVAMLVRDRRFIATNLQARLASIAARRLEAV